MYGYLSLKCISSKYKEQPRGGRHTTILWEAIIFDGQGDFLHSSHMHGLAKETLWGYFKGRPNSIKVYLCMLHALLFCFTCILEFGFLQGEGYWAFPGAGVVAALGVEAPRS